MDYYETSAKTGYNIEAPFMHLVTSFVGYVYSTVLNASLLTLPISTTTSFELGTGAGPKPRYIPSQQTLERLGVLVMNRDTDKGGNKTKAAQKEKGRCSCQ